VLLEYEFDSIGLQLFSVFSYSMSRLSNCHNCFRKQWQKLEEKQQALPLVRADLKQQLHELMAKKLEEESKNDTATLRIRMQSLLS
jgi:hypothetical protein